MQANPVFIGWREWVALPDLNIPRIKAKIDTGARTSVLHAFDIQLFNDDKKVQFQLHPQQRSHKKVIQCVVPVLDKRWVTDSGGHEELRIAIQTLIRFKNEIWPIEITLTSRDNMRFRLLLGRTALQRRFFIDPAASYLHGKNKLNPS